ncbi:MAG: rhomboid family intramembrane serine protease [Myxococcota bacterium]
MIPLRDINPTRSKPWVTYIFIGANVGVFAAQLVFGEAFGRMLHLRFGVIPAVLSGSVAPEAVTLGAYITPLTSMFLHGGWMHILGNMWFLHVFGDNVEEALGRKRFVLFYLLSGLAAALGQIVVDPSSQIPMIGASGAVSGVLAGYVRLYPHARVLTLVPIFIFLQFVELPAYIFIFVWFAIQVFSGWSSLGGVGGGVAWFAHIGGFVAGFALITLLRKGRPPRNRRGSSRGTSWLA